MAPVNKVIPFSSVDGPGNRTAIFFQKCNFNCLSCHNPETINLCNHCGTCVEICPEKVLTLSESGEVYWEKEDCSKCDRCVAACPNNATPKVSYYTISQLVNKVLKYKNFISGVTFSGGECTLYREFITEVSKELNPHDLTCFIDTNGGIDLSTDHSFVEQVDGFMLDIKAWDNGEHLKLSGVDNQTVLKNLDFLIASGKLFEVRTVIIPELLSNKLTVEKISQKIARHNVRLKLIAYRDTGVRKHLISAPSPTEEMMKQMEQVALNNGVKEVILI